MKATLFIIFLTISYIECRKVYKPIDKNANIDFINMETGGSGARGPAAQPVVPAPAPVKPVPTPVPKIPTPSTLKPAVVTPPLPGHAPAKPPQSVQPTPPYQIKPVPVNPAPAPHPITTPGPGSVQHLINFYDNQGKGSPIRPYTYSQAVKQG